MNSIAMPVEHEWTEDKQSRLDLLSTKELTGVLDAAEQRELAHLVSEVEAEEQGDWRQL